MMQAVAFGLARASRPGSHAPRQDRMTERRRSIVGQFPGSDVASEAATPKPSIKLQILLRQEWRTPQGVEKITAILRSVGLMPTVGGLATISADVEPETFKALFGVTATETAPQPGTEREFGRSGGHISPELTVPAALSEFVESISAAPGHIYLRN